MWRNWLVKTVLLLPVAVAFAQSAGDESVGRFETLIKAGQFERVAAQAPDYVASHPKSWQAFYQLGYAYFRLHQNWRSLQALSKSLALNDQFPEAHKILALDLNILGKQELALAELEKAVALDPKSAESNYELGRIEYERGSYLNAAKHLEIAKALDPSAVRVYHNLGLAYAAVGRMDDALSNFDEGLRLNAKQSNPSAWPLIDYGTFLNMRNQFAEARDMLLHAVQIDARWDQAYFELSKAYRGLKQNDDAIAAVKKAITLNHDRPEYHYVLARLYSQTQRTDQAKAELAEYESRRPKDAAK